jgi:pyruvate,water dikinase
MSWLGKAASHVGLFLEIIGLRSPGPGLAREAQLDRFRRHHTAFRRLLGANDSFLLGVAELDRTLVGGDAPDDARLRALALRMLADVSEVITCLNEIGDDRHAALWPPYRTLASDIQALCADEPAVLTADLALDLSCIDHRHADVVGAKMANLGEIKNHVGLPTPDGFALTVHAYEALRAACQVGAGDLGAHGELRTRDDEERLSERLVAALRTTQVPQAVVATVSMAYHRLCEREGRPCAVAVRSSALGEDELFSFAGQYETVLDVGRDALLDAWRQVAASLYSKSAIHYRRMQGLTEGRQAMPVGFVTMVPAIVSGIMFSRDPARPDRGHVVIQVAPGLGTRIADGSVIPQTIEVTLTDGAGTIRRPGVNTEEPAAAGSPDELAEQMDILLERQRALLTDEEAVNLAHWARKLESHFGCPQDVEWAMGQGRALYVLQSRPLELAAFAAQDRPPVDGATLLVRGGEVACPGLGTGVAVHLDEDGDFAAFPQGGVLVVKRPSPRYVRLMGKVAAIVADTGSTTGHMASLAREFRIPTLLGTKQATHAIPAGSVVTVDAFSGHVYAGQVDIPMTGGGEMPPKHRHATRTRLLARRLSELIVPLHLTDPRAPEFRPECCTTLHDITRYVHERSYEEMFRLGESLDDFRSAAFYLDVFLPVDLYIIDLGGGVSAPARGNRIKPSQVQSLPLAALLKGMLHPKIPRWGARPIDLGGFASVVIQHALTSPEQERSFRDPSYALVSDRYVNYTARVGYHFSIVDAYCGETTNKNYIHFLFRGGAADALRRGRRARAIAGILREWGFSVEMNGDSTDGRIHKMPKEEAIRIIEYVGRLMQFMRQMDVAMTSEAAVEEVKQAFLREDYGLDGLVATSPKR